MNRLFLCSAALAGCLTSACFHPDRPSCPDEPFFPSNVSEDHPVLHRCRFSADADWVGTSGVIHFDKGDAVAGMVCAPESAVDPCTEVCAAEAEQLGVLDVEGACEDVHVEAVTTTPSRGCPNYIACNQGDFDVHLSEPTMFCVSSGPRPGGDLCAAGFGELWWWDPDFGCGKADVYTACGYPVYVPPGPDPDETCRQQCPSLLHQYADAELANTNCDTFVKADVCPSGDAPNHGDDFHWVDGETSTEAPLRCDGPCCEEIGFGACANLAANAVVTPAAARTTALALPVRLEAPGGAATGTLTGSIGYSTTSCPPGATCPVYVESLHLGAAVLRGTWPDGKGTPRPFTITGLDVRMIGPTLGGYRSTGDLQLRDSTANVAIRATIDAPALGLHAVKVSETATNLRAILGRITGNSLTLRTTIDLVPGIRVVVGN